jgi:hypothetical protein
MPVVEVGQKVWIPASRIGVGGIVPSALVERTVLQKSKRSITVDTINGKSETISTKLVHAHAGIAIIRIGDLASEATLLDPLAKSVLQFCRLLMPDDFVRLYSVRTEQEIDAIWNRDSNGYRHVILVGHGGEAGIKLFAKDDWLSHDRLREILFECSSIPKIVISLCCSTGKTAFAKRFSSHEMCEAFIAPFRSVHGADASRFTQEFLAYALLDGATTITAFKKAEKSIGPGRDFCFWQNGHTEKKIKKKKKKVVV